MKRRLIVILLVPIAILLAIPALAIGVLRAADINEINLIQSLVGSAALPSTLVENYSLLRFPLQLVFIIVVFFLAGVIRGLSGRLAGWMLSAARYEPDSLRTAPTAAIGESEIQALETRRRHTVKQLVAAIITFTAFTLAIILSLSQFFSLSNLAIIATPS